MFCHKRYAKIFAKEYYKIHFIRKMFIKEGEMYYFRNRNTIICGYNDVC